MGTFVSVLNTSDNISKKSSFKGIFQRLLRAFYLSVFNHPSPRYYFDPILQLFSRTTSLVEIKAKIVAIRTENEGIKTFTIKVPGKWKGFKPGQYINTGMFINGVLVHRIFSISSDTDLYLQKACIEITVQEQTDGKATGWMHQNLKVGDVLSISKAAGEFLLADNHRKPLFIAGGVGITPFMSMLSKLVEDRKQATLLYFAHAADQHIFSERLARFKQKGIDIKWISTAVLGRPNLKSIASMVPDFMEREFYVCGPQGLSFSLKESLQERGFSMPSFHSEIFRLQVVQFAEKANEAFDIFLQKSNAMITSVAQLNMLDTLENAGYQPTYGCRMGICHQCSCKKKSGRVLNILSGKYSDEGEEKIQLCISIPVTDVAIEL